MEMKQKKFMLYCLSTKYILYIYVYILMPVLKRWMDYVTFVFILYTYRYLLYYIFVVFYLFRFRYCIVLKVDF